MPSLLREFQKSIENDDIKKFQSNLKVYMTVFNKTFTMENPKGKQTWNFFHYILYKGGTHKVEKFIALLNETQERLFEPIQTAEGVRETPFALAIAMNSVVIVDRIIVVAIQQLGNDLRLEKLSFPKLFPLHYAMKCGLKSLIPLLAPARIINLFDEQTPLELACLMDDMDSLTLLMNMRVRIMFPAANVSEFSPRIKEVLLSSLKAKNVDDPYKNSLLHNALLPEPLHEENIPYQQWETPDRKVKMLIDLGFLEINLKNNEGKNALFKAAELKLWDAYYIIASQPGCTGIIRLLVETIKASYKILDGEDTQDFIGKVNRLLALDEGFNKELLTLSTLSKLKQRETAFMTYKVVVEAVNLVMACLSHPEPTFRFFSNNTLVIAKDLGRSILDICIFLLNAEDQKTHEFFAEKGVSVTS